MGNAVIHITQKVENKQNDAKGSAPRDKIENPQQPNIDTNDQSDDRCKKCYSLL